MQRLPGTCLESWSHRFSDLVPKSIDLDQTNLIFIDIQADLYLYVCPTGEYSFVGDHRTERWNGPAQFLDVEEVSIL